MQTPGMNAQQAQLLEKMMLQMQGMGGMGAPGLGTSPGMPGLGSPGMFGMGAPPGLGGGDEAPPGMGPPGSGGLPGMSLPGMPPAPGGLSGMPPGGLSGTSPGMPPGMPSFPGMSGGMPSMPGLRPDSPQLPGLMGMPGSMSAGTMPGGLGGALSGLSSLMRPPRPASLPGLPGQPGLPGLPGLPGTNGASGGGGSLPSLPNMNWQQKSDGGNNYGGNNYGGNSWGGNNWNNKSYGGGGGGWKDPADSKMVKDGEARVQDPTGRTVTDFTHYETFDQAPFPQAILDALKAAGFAAPSQIQQYCWPLAMQNKDVIGVAATGSGKTISFLLPAFAHIGEQKIPAGDPSLLVLAPTRELAIQIQEESDKFAKQAGMRTTCCYGGAPKPPQAADIARGLHGVIGTPGRVNDFLEGGQLKLGQVIKLVLDEADRMLDMGFEPQIRKILQGVPAHRQTMFFTATWPKNVRNIASEFLRGAYTVTIGNRDELKGNQDITQTLQTCRGHEKADYVRQLCQQSGVADPRNGAAKALIFCSTKKMCDNLSQQLERKGISNAAIHGDKNQRDREAALNGLKEGRLKALVATDVAARGIDIKNVTLVINFDPAGNIEDYVHRIGRTGRAGQKGHAVALICERDTHALPGILQVMKRTNQPMSPEIEEMARTAPRPPPGGRAMRDRTGPPPVVEHPNFQAGLCSGPPPSPPEIPEGMELPAPAPTSDAGGGSADNKWGSGGYDKWGSSGNDKWSGNNYSSRDDGGKSGGKGRGYEDSNRGRDRDDRGRGGDERGRGREDDRGGRREDDRGRDRSRGRRASPRRRSPSKKRRRSPSVRRNSRRSPSVRRKQRASSSSSSSGDKKRRKKRSPSRKKRKSPSPGRNKKKSPSPSANNRQSPSPIRNKKKSPSPSANKRQSPSPIRNKKKSPSPNRSKKKKNTSPDRSPSRKKQRAMSVSSGEQS